MKAASPALLPLLRSQTQGELLALLFLNPEDEFSLTEVARRTDSSLTTVHAEVSRLVRAGVIRDRRVGNIRLVSADTSTALSEPLTDLLTVTYGPRTVLADELAAVTGIERAFIHGAWAERHAGQDGPVPDRLDVLVVGGARDEAISQAAATAGSRLHRQVVIRQVSVAEWAATSEGRGDGAGLADLASGALVPIDLTPRERPPTRSVSPTVAIPPEQPPPIPAEQHPELPPAEGSGRACPLLEMVPALGARLPHWDLPRPPVPAVPDVVHRVLGGVVHVVSLQWLPWDSPEPERRHDECCPGCTGH